MSEHELSQKIRDLRAMHGLTLEQVAQRVGVGKSTIRKWETGMIENMRRDKIAKLAAALHTSPAYLMGWVDIQPSPAPTFQITSDEKLMILKFRQLDQRGQSAVVNTLEHEYAALPGEKAPPAAKNA